MWGRNGKRKIGERGNNLSGNKWKEGVIYHIFWRWGSFCYLVNPERGREWEKGKKGKGRGK